MGTLGIGHLRGRDISRSVNTSLAIRSCKAPPNIQMVNRRSGTLVKETCMHLHKSFHKCVLQSGHLLQTEKTLINC